MTKQAVLLHRELPNVLGKKYWDGAYVGRCAHATQLLSSLSGFLLLLFSDLFFLIFFFVPQISEDSVYH